MPGRPQTATAGSCGAAPRGVLPGPQCCAPLHQAMPPDFHSLCEQEPIGRRLFKDFLATVAPYQEAVVFLEEVQSWELAEEGPAKGNTPQGLVAPGPGNLHPFLSPALATKCQAATTEEEGAALVALAKAEAMAFLQDQPFRDFLDSPFYDEFLQWKAFAMQPMADKVLHRVPCAGERWFWRGRCLRAARMEDEGYSIKRVLFCPF